MSKLLKITLVLCGYVLAFAGAALAVYIHDLLDNGQTSPGMAAGGDMIFFLAVAGFLALFPTLLALFFLRASRKFWSLFSILGLGLALTAPLAEALNTWIQRTGINQGWWVLAAFLSMLRVFATPLFAAGFLVALLLAPEKRARKFLLAALVLECLVGLYILILFVFWRRLF